MESPNPSAAASPAASSAAAPAAAAAALDPASALRRFSALPPAEGGYNALPTYPVRPSYAEFHSSLRLSTQCVAYDGAPRDPHKPSSVPIYQTATFVQPSSTEFGAYDYTRSGNPTRTAYERQVAMLEGAHAAFAFSTGMAALAAVTRLLRAGDHLLVGDDIYGGMHRLLTRVTGALHGVRVTFVDTTVPGAVEAALTPSTRMLHMETPSNPLMRVTDVRPLAALLRARGVLLSIDSTMMPPVLQRPLELGADIVVHSATKFMSGHSDVMGGLVCTRDPALAQRLAFFQNAEGSGCDPFSCWLFMRGIKTLALRVERAQLSAAAVAAFLVAHPSVRRVHYPAFGTAGSGVSTAQAAAAAHEAAVHAAQAAGPGVVMSFETGSVELSRRFIDALRIFKLTVSFGSVNSLCEMPCMLSHASIPPELRKLPGDLVRLSVGIEDVSDLLADVQQALELACDASVPDVRAVTRRDDAASVDEGAEPAPATGGAGAVPAAAAAATATASKDATHAAELCALRLELEAVTAKLAATLQRAGAQPPHPPPPPPHAPSGETARWLLLLPALGTAALAAVAAAFAVGLARARVAARA